ncbi:hypothetical protein Zmor_012663 [Zophobas morio]|uniref:Uncharacterized protein n=1 Tax=Zophobas morio TaxID=2755281 RepID=A0AA38ICL1_9CUCU|nr:hypothetical protein Zmor_012663 [Zophobas morio]
MDKPLSKSSATSVKPSHNSRKNKERFVRICNFANFNIHCTLPRRRRPCPLHAAATPHGKPIIRTMTMAHRWLTQLSNNVPLSRIAPL